jgi:CheY-like chemotaxis protein
MMLEGDGFIVDSCDGADEAFTLARRERPDLILTDLMLGATSGLDLITRVRSDLAPPVPPVVVCSGFTIYEQEARQRGAVAFIPKPFETTTIRNTINTILARHTLAAKERAEAAVHAQQLRARAVAVANAAAQRLAPRVEDLSRRARLMTDFLPRYFGFGEAFVAVIRGEELQVRTSSNELVWRQGQRIDLALCRDMMETRSSLLVPDLLTLGPVVHGPDGKMLRFFTGVPLSIGAICVGVLCFVDRRPHHFGPDGYVLLETCGRRTSAVLSDQDAESAPLFSPSGLLTREGLCVVLGAELLRLERDALTLTLFAFSGDAPAAPLPARTAVAELSERRYAALLTRERSDEGRRALLEFVAGVARADSAGGGLVDIDDGAAASFDPHGIIRAAESLLDGALREAPGTIDRVVIRREAYGREPIPAPTHH